MENGYPFNTPFVGRQVETHLIFGPVSRGNPFLCSLLGIANYKQAALYWLITKLVMGFVALGLVGIAAPVSALTGKADAWPNLLLGLIWLPGIEFIPRITPNQKIVTVIRCILSIPVIYMGVQSGDWSW